MAINRDRLLNWPFPDVVQTYDRRDTMLYALGLGIGGDPLDPAQLQFVYEDGLRTLPAMGVTLGYPGFWLSDPATGADWRQLLHGEQGIELFRPLPPAATVIGRTRVTDVIDKGAGRGALVLTERDVIDTADNALLCRLRSTGFLRGDGGFGGPAAPKVPPHLIPDRAPDHEVVFPTLPQAALIYRLSGDYNPLHADPGVARAGGFERPILQGLCTFGIAGYALVAAAAAGDPARLGAMDARFTAPVFPGETVVTQIWIEAGGGASFRSSVRERGIVVLNNGRARIAASEN